MKNLPLFQELARLEKERKSCVLCTIVSSHGSTPRKTGSKMLVYHDGSFMGTIGGGEVEQRILGEALSIIRTGKSKLIHYRMVDPEKGDPGVCGGELDIYVEPVVPVPTILIIGGGHVGKSVAHLASWLGFYVIVSDDRPEYCSAEFNPDADEYLPGPIGEISEKLEIDVNYFIVLTTRSVDLDVVGLPGILDTPAAYIGVIGSKRRWAITRTQLLEKGVNPGLLDRVKSPMGLDIKAETPEEIAVSIMGEIIEIRKSSLKDDY